MESQCKGDCIKFQDELWQWKNRAVVAEYKLMEMEKEAELIETKVKEMIEQMKGE